MTKKFSAAERDAMFHTNAARWFWSVLDSTKVRMPESA
jgi:hypothetical protein